MKRIHPFISSLLIILLIAAGFVSPAQAQTAPTEEPACRDAAGGVIPCPPDSGNEDEEDKEDEEKPTKTPTSRPTRIPTNTPTPTVTNTPNPTNTPLPITDKPTENPTKNAPLEITPTESLLETVPSDGSEDEGGEWNGVCTGNTPGKFLCTAKFAAACEDLGGTFDIVKDDDTGRHIKCTIPLISDPGASLAAAPTNPGTTGKSGFVGDCSPSVNLGACMEGFVNMCISLGGTPDEMYDEDALGPTGKVGCSDIPSPSDNSLPAPQKPAPDFPPGGWLPWITGFFGLLIGMLLPAVQKVREAAARSGQTREHVLLNKEDGGDVEPEQAGIPNLTDKPDGGSTEHKDWIRIESMSQSPDSGASSGAMPQTKEHVLLNKDDEPQADNEPTIKNKEEYGSTEAAYLKLGDIKGDCDAQTDDTSTIKNKEEDGSTEAGYLKIGDIKGESSDAQTREHILLSNQDAAQNGVTSRSKSRTVIRVDH